MITYFFTMKSKRFLKLDIYFNDSGESRMVKMVKVKQRIEDFASGDVRDKDLRQIANAVGEGSVAGQAAYNYYQDLKD